MAKLNAKKIQTREQFRDALVNELVAIRKKDPDTRHTFVFNGFKVSITCNWNETEELERRLGILEVLP